MKSLVRPSKPTMRRLSSPSDAQMVGWGRATVRDAGSPDADHFAPEAVPEHAQSCRWTCPRMLPCPGRAKAQPRLTARTAFSVIARSMRPEVNSTISYRLSQSARSARVAWSATRFSTPTSRDAGSALMIRLWLRSMGIRLFDLRQRANRYSHLGEQRLDKELIRDVAVDALDQVPREPRGISRILFA